MITIKLLGGARKAVGNEIVRMDARGAKVSEVLSFLKEISTEPRTLDPTNVLIAVNGVECSALQGTDTAVKNGDTVTVVTVVHGGVNVTSPHKD